MKDKWYNKEISSEIALIILVIIIIAFCFIPIYSIECSNNNCSLYSRSVILRNPKFINWFKISDIERYEINKVMSNSTRRGIPFCNDMQTYYIHIYLKSGEIIFIDNGFNTLKRAQEVYNDMVSNSSFSLKGNFWNSLFDSY